MKTDDTTCTVTGCGRPTRTRGWCAAHYTRWKRYGDPEFYPLDQIDHEARFWAKVDKRGPEECWPWLGTITSNGYGQFRAVGRRTTAHRFAYEFAIGPIPDGLTIDHVRTRGCTRTDCVNPAHLEAVTLSENLRRSGNVSSVNRAKTHCPNGHEYDGVKQTPRGPERFCRQCANDWQREYRASRRSA